MKYINTFFKNRKKIFLFFIITLSVIIFWKFLNTSLAEPSEDIHTNITDMWGVNITPYTGSISKIWDLWHVSYLVSVWNMWSSDFSQYTDWLYLDIPKDAQNLKFTLVWLPGGEKKLGTETSPWWSWVYFDYPYLHWEKWFSEDLDFPITFSNGENYRFKVNSNDGLESFKKEWNTELPIINEVNSDTQGWAYESSIIHTVPRGFKRYSIFGIPMFGLKVEFDMVTSKNENYFPIRAFIGWKCFGMSNNSWNNEMVGCESIIDNMGQQLLELKTPENIWKKDFDENGIYTHPTRCAVTKNLGHWYTIGDDVDPWIFDFSQSFYLRYNANVQYDVALWEDMCDQAVSTILVQ